MTYVPLRHVMTASALACSVFVMALPNVWAQNVGDVVAGAANQTIDGQQPGSGSYYSTNGDWTTFKNSGAGGLHVTGGTTIRGLEVNGGNALTGNGGNVRFYAPGSVIRIDGTVDVNAIHNGSAYAGNGGKAVFVSDYLYQNGQIYANGIDGGAVRFNVGSATFMPNSVVEARSFGGRGGHIGIHGNGFVDVRQSALFGCLRATGGPPEQRVDQRRRRFGQRRWNSASQRRGIFRRRRHDSSGRDWQRRRLPRLHTQKRAGHLV